MQALKNIGMDYKFTAVFGIIALLLSVLTGLLAGISVGVVVIRSLVLALVFSLLGYAVVFVVKRFVPEVYEMISDRADGLGIDVVPEEKPQESASVSSEEISGSGEEGGDDAGMPMADTVQAAETTRAAGPKQGDVEEEGFTEFKEQDFPRMEAKHTDDSGLNATLSSSDTKKYGKHILVKDEFVRYEPKVMAAAVRTMMRKDED